MFKGIACQYLLKLRNGAQKYQNLVTQSFLQMLLNRVGQWLTIGFGTFKENVSTLNIRANIRESQFREDFTQALHFYDMTADIDAPQKRYIDHVLSSIVIPIIVPPIE